MRDLEESKSRLLILAIVFFVFYISIVFKLVQIGCFRKTVEQRSYYCAYENATPRADILDVNGAVLATDVIAFSAYADPAVMIDKEDAIKKIRKICPKIDVKVLKKKIETDKRFVWVVRKISPQLKEKLHDLGIPGLYFRKEYHRVYPYGSLATHVVGQCDVDNRGNRGIERYFDQKLREQPDTPIRLALDIRIQHMLRDILYKGIQKHQGQGGLILLMDNYGQIISCISLPDDLDSKNKANEFNRCLQASYEFGSIMKIVNVAIALQTGATLDSRYDASHPLRIGRFVVTDFRGKNRVLSLTEAFIYSSNIAASQMAREYGIQNQKRYFEKLGLLRKTPLETFEIGRSITPAKWTEASLQTLSYGYGGAFPPITALAALGTILNDGHLIQPTLLARSQKECDDIDQYKRNNKGVISLKVSRLVSKLTRLVVKEGSAKKADIPGLDIRGKTGTSYILKNGHYDKTKRQTTFFSCIKTHKKREFYMLLSIEDPKPSQETYGFAAAGWNVVPVSAECLARLAPLLNVEEKNDL